MSDRPERDDGYDLCFRKAPYAERCEVDSGKGLDSCTFGTDYIRLLQLVNNLVNNAIKNTKKGSITMGYKALEDGRLNFYVKDTGQG